MTVRAAWRNQAHDSACGAAAGYDFINSAEATAAEVMSAAGYNAVHYGKW
jgi:arylsulfatase A-like enzyme